MEIYCDLATVGCAAVIHVFGCPGRDVDRLSADDVGVWDRHIF